MDDHDLVDTGEMYLKAVLELEEEGVAPLRARLVERFAQSGPTVSQTVDRLRRNDLLDLDGNRQILLTGPGRTMATSIMRKHRLTEVFLQQVVGLEWHLLHVEACRWEHVVSDHTENLIDQLLGHPTHSPYGNPITRVDQTPRVTPVESLIRRAEGTEPVWISWIGEPLQADPDALEVLFEHGLTPGAQVTVARRTVAAVTLADGQTLPEQVARHVFVSATAPELGVTPQLAVPGGVELLAR